MAHKLEKISLSDRVLFGTFSTLNSICLAGPRPGPPVSLCRDIPEGRPASYPPPPPRLWGAILGSLSLGSLSLYPWGAPYGSALPCGAPGASEYCFSRGGTRGLEPGSPRPPNGILDMIAKLKAWACLFLLQEKDRMILVKFVREEEEKSVASRS